MGRHSDQVEARLSSAGLNAVPNAGFCAKSNVTPGKSAHLRKPILTRHPGLPPRGYGAAPKQQVELFPSVYSCPHILLHFPIVTNMGTLKKETGEVIAMHAPLIGLVHPTHRLALYVCTLLVP